MRNRKKQAVSALWRLREPCSGRRTRSRRSRANETCASADERESLGKSATPESRIAFSQTASRARHAPGPGLHRGGAPAAVEMDGPAGFVQRRRRPDPTPEHRGPHRKPLPRTRPRRPCRSLRRHRVACHVSTVRARRRTVVKKSPAIRPLPGRAEALTARRKSTGPAAAMSPTAPSGATRSMTVAGRRYGCRTGAQRPRHGPDQIAGSPIGAVVRALRTRRSRTGSAPRASAIRWRVCGRLTPLLSMRLAARRRPSGRTPANLSRARAKIGPRRVSSEFLTF